MHLTAHSTWPKSKAFPKNSGKVITTRSCHTPPPPRFVRTFRQRKAYVSPGRTQTSANSSLLTRSSKISTNPATSSQAATAPAVRFMRISTTPSTLNCSVWTAPPTLASRSAPHPLILITKGKWSISRTRTRTTGLGSNSLAPPPSWVP